MPSATTTEPTAIEKMQKPPESAEDVVRSHVIWALGAGLVPVPLFDIVAVTAIQLDMLKKLAALHGADYSLAQGKAFVSALTGSTFAKLGSSAIKSVPGLGQVLGGISMSALSGASTYAVGQVAIQYLEEEGGEFPHVDFERARSVYNEALERGKKFVSNLSAKKEEESKDVFKTLALLGQLKKKGVLTEEEFEAKKRELLDRL